MPDLTEQDEADLAALADGQLDPTRRAALEARPELAGAIAAQRAAVAMIAGAAEQVSAPLALRAHVVRLQAKPERRRFRLPGWLAPAVAAAAAAVVAVVVLGGSSPPISEVLAAAVRPPVAAISPVPGKPLLRAQVDDVPFPDFTEKFGWRATGTRTDRIGGRDTRTVYYARGTAHAAYTIVGGDALDETGDVTTQDGVRLSVFAKGDRIVVTWQRRAHTCVLSSDSAPRAALLELAAWRAKGDIPF